MATRAGVGHVGRVGKSIENWVGELNPHIRTPRRHPCCMHCQLSHLQGGMGTRRKELGNFLRDKWSHKIGCWPADLGGCSPSRP
jgi:hypothetical protein